MYDESLELNSNVWQKFRTKRYMENLKLSNTHPTRNQGAH
jgi:hypothetical protein